MENIFLYEVKQMIDPRIRYANEPGLTHAQTENTVHVYDVSVPDSWSSVPYTIGL